MMNMYVLTREINAYDQDGVYFENVWDHKPSVRELSAFVPKEKALFLLETGGGRVDLENEWFYLTEVR